MQCLLTIQFYREYYYNIAKKKKGKKTHVHRVKTNSWHQIKFEIVHKKYNTK